MLRLHLNFAHCCLKLKWRKRASAACREVLDIERNNTKALFSLGKAQRMLENYGGASYYLARARRILPQGPSILEELHSLKDQLVEGMGDKKPLCQDILQSSGPKEGRDEHDFDVLTSDSYPLVDPRPVEAHEQHT